MLRAALLPADVLNRRYEQVLVAEEQQEHLRCTCALQLTLIVGASESEKWKCVWEETQERRGGRVRSTHAVRERGMRNECVWPRAASGEQRVRRWRANECAGTDETSTSTQVCRSVSENWDAFAAHAARTCAARSPMGVPAARRALRLSSAYRRPQPPRPTAPLRCSQAACARREARARRVLARRGECGRSSRAREPEDAGGAGSQSQLHGDWQWRSTFSLIWSIINSSHQATSRHITRWAFRSVASPTRRQALTAAPLVRTNGTSKRVRLYGCTRHATAWMLRPAGQTRHALPRALLSKRAARRDPRANAEELLLIHHAST